MWGKFLSDERAEDNLTDNSVDPKFHCRLCAVKADVVCLLFLPCATRISRVHPGAGMMPHCLPVAQLLLFIFFLLCVWNSIFSAQLLQSCIQENAEISANRTQHVWADKISDKVVIVILRLGEQDWKITQLGTDTSHIKYSQMEQTTQN